MIFVKNLESVSDQEWSKTDKYPGVRWKFLIDADVTGSSGLSLGFAEIEPGGDLILHYHSPAEIYVVTDGVGTLNKSGELEEIKKGETQIVEMKNNLNALAGALQQTDLFIKQIDDDGDVMPPEKAFALDMATS